MSHTMSQTMNHTTPHMTTQSYTEPRIATQDPHGATQRHTLPPSAICHGLWTPHHRGGSLLFSPLWQFLSFSLVCTKRSAAVCVKSWRAGAHWGVSHWGWSRHPATNTNVKALLFT